MITNPSPNAESVAAFANELNAIVTAKPTSKTQVIDFQEGRLPRLLEDAIDSFYQTWRFARDNGIKFDRELTMTRVREMAERYHYTVTVGKKAGQFILERPTMRVFVEPETFPIVTKEPRDRGHS